MMKKQLFRVSGLLSLFLYLVCCIPVKILASESEPRKVCHEIKKVAYTETKGFSEMKEDGTRYGIIIDYLDEIAKYTGWRYEYVDVKPEEITDALKNGEVDLVGGAYYSPYLTDIQGYPEYNTGCSRILLLARWEDEDILNNDVNSLEGKTIGISARAKETQEFVESFLNMYHVKADIREFSMDEFVDGSLNCYLENGEVDILVAREADDVGKFRTVQYIDAQPHYIVCRKDDKKTLEELNYALREINLSNPNFGETVTYNNFPHFQNLKFYLTKSEKEYITSHEKIRVMIPDNLYPLVMREDHTKEDNYTGITPKMLKKVAELTGLKFEYIPYDVNNADSAGIKDFFKEQSADLIACAMANVGEFAKLGFSTSATYVSLPRTFFRNKNYDFCYEGMVLAMVKNQSIPDSVRPAKILYYDTMKDVLSAVDKGKADLGFSTVSNLQYLRQMNFFPNIIAVTTKLDAANFCFATDTDGDSRLLTIMNKAINSLGEDEILHIREENQKLPEMSNTVLIQELVYENAVKVMAFFAVFFLIIFASISMVLRSRFKSQRAALLLADAESANKAKSVFLSHMSHDIRTPINGIVGMTHIAMENLEDPKILKKSLEKIAHASAQLETLVNEVLEMSHIESGKMVLVMESFDVVALRKEIELVISSMAESYDVEYESLLEIEHSRLIGSPVYLERVVMNILTNAVKYTPRGGKVKAMLSEEAMDAAKGMFVICVSDNGIGMSQDFLEHIFEPFAREHSDAGTTYSGTGLGMSITKELVELMKGTIKIESELDKGTTVTIRIPIEYDLREPEKVESKCNSISGLTILLVEDNEINSEIANYILKENGAIVELVENGKSAVEMFVEKPAGYYDLILMDIMMPVMDGYIATEQIRQSNKEDAKRIPIIAMTANAFTEDADKCIACGMNDHISKPIDISELLSKIKKYV